MYDLLAQFAQIGGLLYFLAMFIGVIVYVLAPGNKVRLDMAARIPLEDDTNPEARGR